MADINVLIALDLKTIVDLSIYSDNINKMRKISNQYVHVLAPDGSSIKDYGGVNATISEVDIDDSVNWNVVNYSEFNSELSAILINYKLVDSKKSVTPPELVSGDVYRPYINNNEDINDSIKLDKIRQSYWTSNVLGLNVTEKYNGILKIYRKDELLGYAYFEQSMTFKV
ncbi:inclusion body family protein [Xenorhabdus sp. XENO-1]|uniref:AidA/PixA family protein n=1 Tax=Xenorhabdus bovienii TaxID=40576 RepID=UPI0020CA2C47|nr:AidA/PixA family protein [Xenorhabdus bovienii]MCP9270369.1 inclusion body family protein [Xenorhabdus bovienii subsp. africana]